MIISVSGVTGGRAKQLMVSGVRRRSSFLRRSRVVTFYGLKVIFLAPDRSLAESGGTAAIDQQLIPGLEAWVSNR